MAKVYSYFIYMCTLNKHKQNNICGIKIKII